MKYIKFNPETLFVEEVLYVTPIKADDYTEVPDFDDPEPREDMYAELYYRNGKVEFEYKPIPPEPIDEQ